VDSEFKLRCLIWKQGFLGHNMQVMQDLVETPVQLKRAEVHSELGLRIVSYV